MYWTLTTKRTEYTVCSDEGLTLETSNFQFSKFTTAANLIKIYLYQLHVDKQLSVSLARRRNTTVSLETSW